MGRKAVSRIVLTVILIVVVMLAFNIQQAEATEPPATEWNKTYGGTSTDGCTCMIQTRAQGSME